MADLFLSGIVGDEITSRDVISFLTSNSDDHITVFLNSPGGDVSEGIEIYNLLRASGKNVRTVLTSLAASMGSIIFLAGDERTAMTGARFMIHKPSGLVWGDADDLRDVANQLDTAQNSIESIYKERTGIENINDLVNTSTWFNTDKMSEMGITTTQKTIKMENIIKGEDMAKIDDLKAEKEKLAAEKAQLEEQLEEAKLEAEITAMKADNEKLKAQAVQKQEPVDPEPQTEPVTEPTVEPPLETAGDNNPKEPIEPEVNEPVVEPKAIVEPVIEAAVIDTKKTKPLEQKNEIPAFMQVVSKY